MSRSSGRRTMLVCSIAAGLGLGLMALAGAGLLAWLIGRVVSDRYGWSQWLLWIPTPAALVAAVVGWLASMLPPFRPGARRRGRVMAWTAGVLMLGAYFAMAEHRLLRRAPKPPPGALRVVHWNLDPHKFRPIQPDARPVLELAGDVTFLTHGVELLADQRMQRWTSTGQYIATYYPFTVISRVPIIRARPLVSSGDIEIGMVELDAMPELGRPLVVYMVDLPSNPRRPRAWIAADARKLMDATPAPPPDLVVGDFNMTRDSAALQSIFPEMRHAFDDGGHGYGASFHRAFPLYHIDHMLVSDAVRAARYDLIDPGAGRHMAQVAELAPVESTRP